MNKKVIRIAIFKTKLTPKNITTSLMKKLGVGTYRMTSALHEDLLCKAIECGFSVIDTSPNYNKGESELLVGRALKRCIRQPQVVTKYGFVQGDDLESHQRSPIPDAVEYTDTCFHSIHPEFMRQQLSKSLQRMQVDKVSTYLIHNPEHLLMSLIPPDVNPSNSLLENARSKLSERLSEAFVALEQEVDNGRIESYGITSNSFALPKDHPHFVPFDIIPSLVDSARQQLGKNKSNFSTIELPCNVLERTGATPESLGGNGCAQFCQLHGYEVMINRSLTAFDETGSWRLADSDFPMAYSGAKDALIEHLSPVGEGGMSKEEMIEWNETLEACKWLRTLVNDLDAEVGSFTSVMHYQDDLQRTIVPMINAKLDGMDDDTSELVFKFFSQYELAVRSVAGQQTRSHVFESVSKISKLESNKYFVAPKFPLLVNTAEEPLQEYALQWLHDQPTVSTVLLGCTQEGYANQAYKVFNR